MNIRKEINQEQKLAIYFTITPDFSKFVFNKTQNYNLELKNFDPDLNINFRSSIPFFKDLEFKNMRFKTENKFSINFDEDVKICHINIPLIEDSLEIQLIENEHDDDWIDIKDNIIDFINMLYRFNNLFSWKNNVFISSILKDITHLYFTPPKDFYDIIIKNTTTVNSESSVHLLNSKTFKLYLYTREYDEINHLAKRKKLMMWLKPNDCNKELDLHTFHHENNMSNEWDNILKELSTLEKQYQNIILHENELKKIYSSWS